MAWFGWLRHLLRCKLRWVLRLGLGSGAGARFRKNNAAIAVCAAFAAGEAEANRLVLIDGAGVGQILRVARSRRARGATGLAQSGGGKRAER